jgi:hypothetical protein
VLVKGGGVFAIEFDPVRVPGIPTGGHDLRLELLVFSAARSGVAGIKTITRQLINRSFVVGKSLEYHKVYQFNVSQFRFESASG